MFDRNTVVSYRERLEPRRASTLRMELHKSVSKKFKLHLITSYRLTGSKNKRLNPQNKLEGHPESADVGRSETDLCVCAVIQLPARFGAPPFNHVS